MAWLMHERQPRRAWGLPWPTLHPLTSIFILIYIHNMECSVLFTDEFEFWWNGLSIEEQESVT